MWEKLDLEVDDEATEMARVVIALRGLHAAGEAKYGHVLCIRHL